MGDVPCNLGDRLTNLLIATGCNRGHERPIILVIGGKNNVVDPFVMFQHVDDDTTR